MHLYHMFSYNVRCDSAGLLKDIWIYIPIVICIFYEITKSKQIWDVVLLHDSCLSWTMKQCIIDMKLADWWKKKLTRNALVSVLLRILCFEVVCLLCFCFCLCLRYFKQMHWQTKATIDSGRCPWKTSNFNINRDQGPLSHRYLILRSS